MSLGAIVTILALGLDPFTQQVIRIEILDKAVPSLQATIPVKRQYGELGNHLGAGEKMISTGMRDFINLGVFGPQYLTIAPNCPTRNCTFDGVYHSVGFCSSCEDATHLINRTGTCAPSSIQVNTSHLNCNYTIGSSGKPLRVVQNDGAIGLDLLLSTDENTYRSTFLFDFSQVNASVSGTCDKSIRSCTGAITCSYDACIGTYNASVQNGDFFERLLATANIPWISMGSDNAYQAVNVPCAGTPAITQLKELGCNVTKGVDCIPGYMDTLVRALILSAKKATNRSLSIKHAFKAYLLFPTKVFAYS